MKSSANVTIFTTPKLFRGHFGIIQTNAIRSWLSLRPACEVILFGNEEGTADIAAELGVRHIPEVECNEYGTPLFSSIFSVAQNIASHQIMCFVSADIILISDFLSAVQRVHRYPFLMVGQRWDVELNESINVDDAQWESSLQTRVAKHGKLHPPTAIDYFVFSHGLYRDMPPFATGRAAVDNWMIYQARSLGASVIDATKAVTAVHQNHDYSHHPDGAAGVWDGPERRWNIELMGGEGRGFTTEYATWILTPQGMKRALTPRHLYFRLNAVPVLSPRLYFLRRPMKALTKQIIRLRSALGITRD